MEEQIEQQLLAWETGELDEQQEIALLQHIINGNETTRRVLSNPTLLKRCDELLAAGKVKFDEQKNS